MTALKIYKVHPDVTLPKHQTQQSACFDLAYQPQGKATINGVNRTNSPFVRDINLGTGIVKVAPGERAMIPTGFKFDIPEGWSVRIHPRSGLSYKSGIVLANCEGVIDSDYVEEIFILLHNTSEVAFTLTPGDRIAQAELVKVEQYDVVETLTVPTQKTDRVGGMGSTGINAVDNFIAAAKEAEVKLPKPSRSKKRVDKKVKA
jgi:dUTP pyrophosphatase